MMKRLIAMMGCAVLAGMLVCVSPLVQEQPAKAQWQVPTDTIPRGRGVGQGFGTSAWSINSNNTLTGAPSAASASPGLVITQSGPTGGASLTGPLHFNKIIIGSDNANVISDYTNGFYVEMTTGGGATHGARAALHALLNYGASSTTAADLITANFQAQASAPNGGTNTGAGAAGTLFGGGFVSSLKSGATNFFSVSGAEIDVGIESGATAKHRLGWSIVGIGSVYPSTLDGALEVAAAGLAWKTGILFSSLHGTKPVATVGTLIGTDGTAETVANGIDFSAYTITGNFLKGPASSFTVDGSGNVTGRTVAITSPSNVISFSLNDGTVSGVFGAGSLFTHSLLVGSSSNHNFVFQTNNMLAGYFDTSQQFNLGAGGISQGVLNINGLTSGAVSVKVQAAAGTYNFNLPTAAGSSGECLKSAGGGSSPMTFGPCASAITPAALTKTDDSNVTLTLGGTPTTALLQATSITVGWTGDLPFSRFVQGAANTVVANATSGTADFAAFAMPSCSTSGSALIWTTNTGFGCNTSINAATLLTGTWAIPGTIGSTTPNSGAFTTLSASGVVSANSTTDSATGGTASLLTAGGLYVAKQSWFNQNGHFKFVTGTGAGFWLASCVFNVSPTGTCGTGIPTDDRFFFGADAGNNDAFRIFSVNLGTNIAVFTAGTTVALSAVLYNSNLTVAQNFTLQGGMAVGFRTVTAAGAVTAATTDYAICINKTVGAATTANLFGGPPTTGAILMIKDCKGDAATNNITVTPAAGTIDGLGTYVINTNFGAWRGIYNGASWSTM